MADDLMVEILDQNWVRRSATNNVVSASITRELGTVGEATVEIPVDDVAASFLPNPDVTSPYEGRFRIYEDGILQFAGVIDTKSVNLSESGSSITFGGKHRGIQVGFYNTGRFDYLGWNIRQIYRELLRNNVAKEAVLVSVTSEEELYPAYQMVTGDPFKQNYWKTSDSTGTHTATFDLGSNRNVTAIRVMPQWWKDIDTNQFHYHSYNVELSTDGSSWTEYAAKGGTAPSSSLGHLSVLDDPTPARYFRINVTDSTDGIARIAQILVYENIAEIGSDTTYTTPFVENDDSGNCETSGSISRPVTPGAFQGDSVITHSYTTRLSGSGQSITHNFRGVSNAVFFTSHTNGSGVAKIYVDGVDRGNVSIANNKYWFKGYDTIEDFGEPLEDTDHTLKVEWVSGTVQVDYFNGLFQTSWRPIEDDDPSIGYRGNWTQAEASYYHNFFASVSEAENNRLDFRFFGTKIQVIGDKGPGFGSFGVYIDEVLQTTVNCNNATALHKQVLYEFEGDFSDYVISLRTTSASKVVIDRLQGNFVHTLYIRARYEANLKVLTRVSEILDSYLRFNDDGTVDLLGAVGTPSGTAIIEGTNEGGTMINARVENEWSETGSAVLAIVNVNGELPIKAMVIDKEAVAEIGFKVIKLDQSDAADQFLLNRQALQYLREKRKPSRSYNISYDPSLVGTIEPGETTRLYSPSSGLDGESYRVGRMTTTYRTT